jgi:hypothetical protein
MDLAARIEEMCIPVPWTGCLLFTGRLSKKGYPLISEHGREHRAHRVTLAAKLGRPLLRTEFACHECDVRGCCEPTHLFPGTNQENVDDKCAKGRQGRVHGPRKLRSHRQAEAVRKSRARGVTVAAIAARTGLSERQVERICAGTSWKPRRALPRAPEAVAEASA